MQRDSFMALPKTDIAELVNQQGPHVIGFPINGTRRWFLLEQGEPPSAHNWQRYLDLTQQQHIVVYTLLFDHGINTILAPMFGPDLLERGPAYLAMASQGLHRLVEHEDFTTFYDEYEVRIGFYGDYKRHLHADLIAVFEAAAQRTAHHTRHRLLFGVFGHDPTEQVAAIGAAHMAEHGILPDRRAIIEAYYGDYLPSIDLFIGFDRFAAFDMPLLATGEEDLYFMQSPSLYLDQPQLRAILYDHLFTRPTPDPDYAALTPEQVQLMRSFYAQNRGFTHGVGSIHPDLGIWIPLHIGE